MRLVIMHEKATRALGAVLAHLDPGYVPGSPLSPAVQEVGEALGLLPYTSQVNLTGGARRKDRAWQTPRLVRTAEEEPILDVQITKFS